MKPGQASLPVTPLPVVVLIGRPNVGKSSLLNRLARRRIAIVEETPGITRDRISTVIRHGEKTFEVVDTGGMGSVDRGDLAAHVAGQIEVALLAADLILFVVDCREGLTPLDEEIARRLRGLAKPVLVVANKAEARDARHQAAEFYRLGMGQPLPVSAREGENIGALLEAISARIPKAVEEESPPPIKLAIVGQRNAGKSTLLNRLVREERVIVSEVPGTTRDSVDVAFEWEGRRFLAIDTAGIRRRHAVDGTVEYYGQHRAQRAVRRADVVLFLFDVSHELTSLDRRIIARIRSEYKPCVLVGNKWDLATGHEPGEFHAYVARTLPGMSFAPLVFISASEGLRIDRMLALAVDLYDQSRARVPTGELNRLLAKLVEKRSPPPRGGKVAKFLYATQASVAPPTIVLFVSDPDRVGRVYLRYLENAFREHLSFSRVPLRIVMRRRGSLDEAKAT